jgi:hypothetical protein
VFTSSTRLNRLLSLAFFLALAGCGDIGAGCGCNVQPLPNEWLPADQTVEGGGQIRVSQAGFQKLTAVIPGVINDQLGSGFCIDQGSTGYTLGTGADYCAPRGGTPEYNCTGQSNGCQVNVDLNSINLAVDSAADVLNIQVSIDINAGVPVNYSIIGIGGSCLITLDAQDIVGNIDVAFGVRPSDGELTISLANIRDFDFSGINISGCVVGDLADVVVDIVSALENSFLGPFINDLLAPVLDGLIQGFLPDPLGIEGLIDVGGLVGGISPGTEASLEGRFVPGGYVDLGGNGLSLGLITGINADEDTGTRGPSPTTRDPLNSEPSYCVPPIPAPDFSAPPASLPYAPNNRRTFSLRPAGEFGPTANFADDLVIGLSETTLDLGGHHAVTSGAMCLGVGTSLVAQLNLGTFSLLVPSLANLGDGTNPVLLVTRPQKALDFVVGTGTEEDPSLQIGLQAFEVDIYVFIYERYVRAFTMSLDLNLGVNLTFDQPPGMPATITPTLVGLSADNITVEVLNNEFVAESAQDLEGILPTIFDLAAGLLGDGLGAIEVPTFAGFSLNNLRVAKVTTSEDDFLAIYASLGTSAALRELGARFPSVVPALEKIDEGITPPTGPRLARAEVTLASVDTPAISSVRMALKGHPNGRLPVITLRAPSHDELGRPLEYSWNLGHGLWRPFRAPVDGAIAITDKALAWQGRYDIRVRSRVIGDYTTTSEPTELPVIVDSVGPEVVLDEARFDGQRFSVPARDLVSPATALRWAWGRPGDDQPWTDYAASASLDRETLEDLVVAGELAVYVVDEAGNVTRATTPIEFHGQAGEGGCACAAGSDTPSTGGVLLLLATVALLGRRRLGRGLARVAARVGAGDRRSLRRLSATVATWAGVLVVGGLLPACDCGGDPGVQACEVTEDCVLACPEGELPFCLGNTCVCIDDVPYGRIGPYSDVAVDSTNTAWISAYAESHGDLVVAQWNADGRVADEAWEFVDGVPDGPVAIPGSEIRGGITAPGDNVGKYTSIAVGPGDVPMVSYFDIENGALRFAGRFGGTWQIHTVDEGSGEIDPELGGETAGLFTALTLRADDGRPGIAYMALVSAGNGVVTAEVRFAAAQSATPTGPEDWLIIPVDSIVLPPVDEMNPDVYPLPGGLGLFIDAARDPATQAPVLAYYDRQNGDLKVARLNATSGAFEVSVLAGGDGTDAGWYPSVAVDDAGTVHASYLSATRDDLMYVTSAAPPSLVDDGYRIVGTTEDGLPKPEFHFVGDDSNMILLPGGPVVVYQDATSHELLYSALNSQGIWQRRTIAGAEDPFVGAYGFFASAVRNDEELVISNWVIDQQRGEQWVEIHRELVIVE